MYATGVSLPGFLGKDADQDTFSRANCLSLSLATKRSWKDRQTHAWKSDELYTALSSGANRASSQGVKMKACTLRPKAKFVRASMPKTR